MASLRHLGIVLWLVLSAWTLHCVSAQTGADSDDLVWFIQLSDLHISKHYPERAADLKAKVATALSIVQPSVVLITGDLTESRSAARYPTRQDDWEWYEYNTVIAALSKASGVPIESIVDIRGNHDTFGVGLRGGSGDFYPTYGAIGGRANRTAGALQRVFTVNLEEGDGPKHVLVGIDAAQEVGLRGPCNFFGMPSDALLDSLDSTLEHINRAPTGRPPTIIAFGHFTLSFMARTESGRRVEDVLKKHGVSAYLCGHLHARFGGLLHKFYSGPDRVTERKELESDDWIAGLDLEEEAQSTEGLRRKLAQNTGRQVLSDNGRRSGGFWEWEMGDWKESRFMRLVAIRRGQISFSDVQFSKRTASDDGGHEATAEYRRSIGLGRVVENEGTTHDSQVYDEDSALILVLSPFNGQYRETVGVSAIEALVFSRHEPLDVSAQIWDRGSGFSSKGSIAQEVKLERDFGREPAVLYVRTWDSTPYENGCPGRYWIQIVVRDSTGQKLASRQQPFVIRGGRDSGERGGVVRVPLFKQSLASFLLIGVRWDELYMPALVGIYMVLLGCILLLPRFWASYLQSEHRFEEWTVRVVSRPLRVGWNPLVLLSRLLEIGSWALCQSATRTAVWLPQVAFLSYLALGPWFWGQALDDPEAPLASFYLRHWEVPLAKNGASVTTAMPCTLILAVPFFLLVLFPWMLWIAAFGAYWDVAKRPALKASLSIPPRRDIEHQLEPRSGGETSKLSRSDSASNLARGAVAQRRRALSKNNLKEKEEEEQVLVQSSALRTGPRGLETLGWAIRSVGVLLGLWTLLHTSIAARAYGATVLMSPYFLGLVCVVLSALLSLR